MTEKTLRYSYPVLLSLVLFFGLMTFFWGLAQYSTADQSNTLQRFKIFLSQVIARPEDFSHFSNLTVAIVGSWLEKMGNAYFQEGEVVLGGLRYSTYLPYHFMQVLVSLVFLTGIAYGFCRIAAPKSKKIDWTVFGFTCAMLVCLPWTKALIKVLKYDAISMLAGTLCIIFYWLSIQEEGKRALKKLCLAAFFAAVAMIEKDTSISILFGLAAIDYLRAWNQHPLKSRAQYLAPRWGLAGITFLASCYIMYPGGWFVFKYFLRVLASAGWYLNMNPKYLLFPLGGLVFLEIFRPYRLKVLDWIQSRKYSVEAITGASVLVICIFSLFYQANDVFLPETAKIKSDTVLKLVGPYWLTTYDTSQLVTFLKCFSENLRLLFYNLPEGLLLLLALPVALFFKKTRKWKSSPGFIVFSLFLIFLQVTAYSAMGSPIDPKYLAPLHLLWVGIAVVQLSNFLASPVMKILLLLAWVPSLVVAGSSYLGYINILRTPQAENQAWRVIFATPYTWSGWGESIEGAQDFIEENSLMKKPRLGYDYSLAQMFYKIPAVELVSIDFSRENKGGLKELRDALTSKEWNLDYVLITKTMSYRSFSHANLIFDFEPLTVWKDVRQGVEYAWLWDRRQLVAAIDKKMGVPSRALSSKGSK